MAHGSVGLTTHSSIRGLIVLGLALSLILMASRFLKQSYWAYLYVRGEGDCIYQVVRGKACVGTIRFREPAHLSAIANGLGLSLPEKMSTLDPLVPCDSAIDLDTQDVDIRCEPLPGTALIALGGKIDLNSAQVEDLVLVPGVGGKLASMIVNYRTKNGTFSSIAEVEKIPGVGEKKRAKMEPFLKIVQHGRCQKHGGSHEP